ncbi:hypothetical protein EXT68_02760 [Pectobacterium parmentieri]|nr:hypothetical protein [Pectobacterium parmentieri]MBI0495172.1 hypothetical protein [Pectobacterium parmentieri]MBI0556224.1 hypothetical protein [Pectobacterium parmentieri]MCL6354426.1 hypothetical protein [Pectobacterium parmentieri]MCL6381611.1 hypothetical protein [Pectobacterium parmentieri]
MNKHAQGLLLLAISGLPFSAMAEDSATVNINATVIGECNLTVDKKAVDFNNIRNSGAHITAQAQTVTVQTDCGGGVKGKLTMTASEATGANISLTRKSESYELTDKFLVSMKIAGEDMTFINNIVERNVIRGHDTTVLTFTPVEQQDPKLGSYSGTLQLKVEPQ